MDSASPTVTRTVGRILSVTGAKLTFFGGTFDAETLATRRRASGCRDPHHRPHGEGSLA